MLEVITTLVDYLTAKLQHSLCSLLRYVLLQGVEEPLASDCPESEVSPTSNLGGQFYLDPVN